jgi:UDP-2-acetamido-3-amino-2,3-dideoxy-glucuronate N-acetyltransferase
MINLDRNELTSTIQDTDGILGVTEFLACPFTPRRFFWLTGMENDCVRANHAHKSCHQLLICQQGELIAKVTRGDGEKFLYKMSVGTTLHLPPLHWLELVNFSRNAVLGVLASEPYDKNEYITNTNELTELWNSHYNA